MLVGIRSRSAEDEFRDGSTLLMEGDHIYHNRLFSVLLNSRYKTSVLVDMKKQLDPTRAVIVVGKGRVMLLRNSFTIRVIKTYFLL